MSVVERVEGALALGGVALDAMFAALRRVEPDAHACYVYDLDAVAARARRVHAAFAPLQALVAYALKANALGALLEVARENGLGAEAGSLGELEAARRAGFERSARVLNGNGRTPEEAAWVAGEGVHSVNADHVAELELLEREAARRDARVRVALRVNPGIETPGHRYVATGHGEAKFGVSPAEALAAWQGRRRWPHLQLDGIHLHVGSQLLDPAPLEEAAGVALALRDESARRGAPLAFVNLGGGFGVDYARRDRLGSSSDGGEFPLEDYAARLAARVQGLGLEWVIEPGRWLVATTGVLIAEVLWVKPRDGRRFVILGAGMNDLLRPALYHARHAIVPVRPRPGALEPATVVGPVCESADVFDAAAPLPPLEPGDLVAILDAGAYGAAMASNYNGRGRLAELTLRDGRLTRVRASESPRDLAARDREERLEL